ncbi:MAG: polysaccharide deacetylase family protein [Flavobacterium sp.]|nr:polysaccharide deacetylase family protein [Flavobacterium sp.]
MYHNFCQDQNLSQGLTISVSKFEQQLRYLSDQKYTSYFASELENLKVIALKSIVLTFDDVTENQLIHAVPLLKKYNFKATFFIPYGYIDKTDKWNASIDNLSHKIMTLDQLKSLDSNIIELGHHSYLHQKYDSLSTDEIQKDFDACFNIIRSNNLQITNSLAYPYGNFPKKNPQKKVFFKILEENSIKMGFRIGNKVNTFPFKNKYEIQRIDVKGQDSFLKFRLKLKFGKLKLF